MQTMGNLCHEVAKLQADRAQLEELLAQVLTYLAVADFATKFCFATLPYAWLQLCPARIIMAQVLCSLLLLTLYTIFLYKAGRQ